MSNTGRCCGECDYYNEKTGMCIKKNWSVEYNTKYSRCSEFSDNIQHLGRIMRGEETEITPDEHSYDTEIVIKVIATIGFIIFAMMVFMVAC